MCMLRGLLLAGFWTGKVFLFFGRIFEGFGVHGFYIYIGEGGLGDGAGYIGKTAAHHWKVIYV